MKVMVSISVMTPSVDGDATGVADADSALDRPQLVRGVLGQVPRVGADQVSLEDARLNLNLVPRHERELPPAE